MSNGLLKAKDKILTEPSSYRISLSIEERLQEAMARLEQGEPRETDGKLTVANLAKEAGVSRATVYRAKEVMKKWRNLVEKSYKDQPNFAPENQERADLQRRVRQLQADNADLRHQLKAAVTVIAELSASLDSRSSASVSLLRGRRFNQD